MEGGGLAISDGADFAVFDSVILENTALATGGGVVVAGATFEATATVIAGNGATSGGGVYGLFADPGQITLRNVAVVGNAGIGVGGAAGTSSAWDIAESVFAYNVGAEGGGFGETSGTGSSAVANSKFWGNEPTDELDSYMGSVGNEVTDPMFVFYSSEAEPGDWDLHLRPGSPLIDGAGPPAPEDPDGTPNDIGAYGGDKIGEDAFEGYYADVDGDLMYDGWEVDHGLDPATDDSANDEDGDGVSNLQELFDGTLPDVAESP